MHDVESFLELRPNKIKQIHPIMLGQISIPAEPVSLSQN